MPFHISHLLPAPTESTDQLLSCPSKLDYPELKMQNSVECEETCLVDKMPATRLLLSSNKHFHVVVQLLIWPQHWKTPILQLCHFIVRLSVHHFHKKLPEFVHQHVHGMDPHDGWRSDFSAIRVDAPGGPILRQHWVKVDMSLSCYFKFLVDNNSLDLQKLLSWFGSTFKFAILKYKIWIFSWI